MKLIIPVSPTRFSTLINVINSKDQSVETVPTTLGELYDNIYHIAAKYYVEKVVLYGNEDYLKKIRRDIMKHDRYSNFDVEIKGVE